MNIPLATRTDSKISRRKVAQLAAFGLAGSASLGVNRAYSRTAPTKKPIGLMQIVDSSAGQQDVTKDFVVGVRAAFSELNQRGGINGRLVNHQIIETDGSASAVDAALKQARGEVGCAALMGTVGDLVAKMVTERTDSASDLCQCAPWLMSDMAKSLRTFNVFANRGEQIAHVVRVMSVTNMRDLGVVYASDADEISHGAELRRATQASQMRTTSYTRRGEWRSVAQKLTTDAPPMLLFVGGTPELIALIQAMGPQTRQRFIIGLADVNLQTVQQLGVPKGINVVAAQVAPMVTSGLSVVRDYRSALNTYFDEPPTSQSLTGYISARVMIDLVKGVDSSDPRGSIAEIMATRSVVELGGFSVSNQIGVRRTPFVTQTMLSADGRVLG